MTISDEYLVTRAKDLLLTLMSNASTDKINPMDWWPRAKSALVKGSARANSWGELVEAMCRSLQIHVLRNDSASSISSMAIDGAHLRAFKRVVRTQGIYIVAEAQAEREIAKAARAAAQEEKV